MCLKAFCAEASPLRELRSILPGPDRRAIAAILAAGVLVAAGLHLTGRMACEEVYDTPSYLEFPILPVEAGLVSIRTYGYPLFVQAILSMSGTKAAVPWAQYVVHVLCVLVWYWGSRTWFPRASLAAMAAASLLVTNTVLRNVSIISTDALASSIAIAAMGALVSVVVAPRSAVRWLLLTALILAAYQIRPAYLFLVPLCPVLGVALIAVWQWVEPDSGRSEPVIGRWRMGGWLACCAAVPLVAFSLLRWVTVGDFGLVSFSGYNFAGLAGEFLDPVTVPCLPEEVQPVAREALRRREALAEEDPTFGDDVTTSYITIENRWDRSTWKVFFPAARTVADGDPVLTNRVLVRLATSIIRCRPKLYAIWLVKAWARGVYMIASELVIHPLVLLGLPVLLGLHFVALARRGGVPGRRPPEMQLPWNALLLIAAMFSAVNIAFIIISSPPLGRFMDAAGVFWLPWFCLVFADRWMAIRDG